MYCIEPTKWLWQDSVGALMTLEDRIRELCVRAIAADDARELEYILAELKLALREHTERLRGMLSHYPLLRTDLINPDA
jgi:hypothetical protein